MGSPIRRHHVRLSCLVLAAGTAAAAAGEPLDVERYVDAVLRSHPSAAEVAGLLAAAEAERTTARIFPDPVFEYARGTGRPADDAGPGGRETAYSIAQTIPWPGSFRAGMDAGEREADVLRADADSVRWELAAAARATFGRLVAARAFLDVARAAEADARSLRDLVARRADLGESRESDRIKATVEWLRQQRDLAAAERAAGAAETIVRALAVEPLPRPLTIAAPASPAVSLPDHGLLVTLLLERNPRARAARAAAAREQALLDAARRGRVPDLELTAYRENELDREADGLRFGIRLPLWNARRGEIARAGAAARIAGAAVESVRISLTSELEDRLGELETAGEQTRLFEAELLPAAGRSVDLVRFSYEEGESSLLDLLDAQRTHRDAQREAIAAHLAFSLALAEVQRLVGPDFDPGGSR